MAEGWIVAATLAIAFGCFVLLLCWLKKYQDQEDRGADDEKGMPCCCDEEEPPCR